MELIVYPGNALTGQVSVPGDKSLSHRAILFAALTEGECQIKNILISGVTKVMLDALTELGIPWKMDDDILTIQGHGLNGIHAPDKPINCGNSATTLRLLAGFLAAAGVPAVLDGSPGLRSRPMRRIVDPLKRMGVQIETSAAGTAPLVIGGRGKSQKLKALDEDLPVASAQVKSCLLLAALAAEGETVLREPGPSRDHTERMLSGLGVKVANQVLEEGSSRCYETRIHPPSSPLKPFKMTLPGDISAAAFIITAATITPGSSVEIAGVGLNPTRTGLLDVLRSMGAEIHIKNLADQGGELSGDIRVHSAGLRGIQVGGPLVVRMIDEFTIFGVAAAAAEGETLVNDAAELRYKESDRIGTLCQELSALGVPVEELEDGFRITGGPIRGGLVHAHGDHRLAMAMAVAGLNSKDPVRIKGAEFIDESFPGFVDTLKSLGANIEERTTSPE